MRLAPFTPIDSHDFFKKEIASVRRVLGVNPGLPLPIGAGFLCWRLDKDEEAGKQLVRAALDEHVKAVWFAFGQDLEKWIKFVRDHDAFSGSKTIIIVLLGTVSKIQAAIQDWKVDIVVAQGSLHLSYDR
jgi:nitronate monooxygenase